MTKNRQFHRLTTADAELAAERLLAAARRWVGSRFCNVAPNDHDDVVQAFVIEAIQQWQAGIHTLEELEWFARVRVRNRAIDLRRANARRAHDSLDRQIGTDDGFTLGDTIASRLGDPLVHLEALEAFESVAADLRELAAYLQGASRRTRAIECLARAGVPRQDIVDALLAEHGIIATHATVRKVISRDLNARFPTLTFLWANKTQAACVAA